jgi:hypothetical protein
MSAGALDTYTKFQNLLRLMSATECADLFQAFGFDFVTTQWISRVTKVGKFNNDVDQKLKPLILRVEDLIERARPFPVAFENSEHINTLLDAIDLGIDLSTNTIPLYKNSITAETTTIPAAQ